MVGLEVGLVTISFNERNVTDKAKQMKTLSVCIFFTVKLKPGVSLNSIFTSMGR